MGGGVKLPFKNKFFGCFFLFIFANCIMSPEGVVTQDVIFKNKLFMMTHRKVLTNLAIWRCVI